MKKEILNLILMMENREERLTKIKHAWQPFYEEELTLQDADEIRINLLKFEECVKRFSQEKKF